MTVSSVGWGNKNGTAIRACSCGSWKQHWINHTGKSWPSECSVSGCYSSPVLGAHVYHPNVKGERIVPMCDSCNKVSNKFNLKDNTMIPSANKTTCA
ncbi:hypothetical protein [Photobacterium angustum]|uniref:hypothetical protein n=1 Tax=Photobacterium angustum TaxID=661 RepID=UPI0005E19E46|nr:hypothetical protein [Photobacterium angustum]KJG16851.1 hypothetical protein UA33_12585 [Photobacterium angustum]KJG23130.1 hypothetical protein UA39_11995 [Photobacterium angustum]KJG30163.1 hypothetical protein UA36_13015 [Photobacterium angustum]PSW96937.1 hypothetical protein C0W79_01415 [Photobacterium angustum]PSX00570.1 hypothetical protein C0W87_17505 [Photobacterium angustum]